MADEYFAAVIGTGFAGAVTACRLVEAGRRICIIERGRRYSADDFPRYPSEDLFDTGDARQDTFRPPPDFSRWLWSRDHGIFDVKDLDELVSVQAAGWGGGSLVYANVHLRPPRALFEHGWPAPYRSTPGQPWPLDPYYDLAAQMLEVAPIPLRLAKTEQLKHAAGDVASEAHWFRTPLAVNFTDPDRACDMRGRCCLGCDRGAKNSLDRNYLARAEHPDAGKPAPDVFTLAEVTKITRLADGSASPLFEITFKDGLRDAERQVRASHVFLCAGALNTTRLLMDMRPKIDAAWTNSGPSPLGSHYFPNADSIASVFDCDAPHEADYGPTITSAMLVDRPVTGDGAMSIDFVEGTFDRAEGPRPGLVINGSATLAHVPQLDWGTWTGGDAAGTLVVTAGDDVTFAAGDELSLGSHGKARARGSLVRHRHWFLVEDGGYPPDMEPLVGIFRSPLWLRRNRYIEFDGQAKPPARRAGAEHLRLGTLGDSVGATAMRGGTAGGFFDRSFTIGRFQGADLLAKPVDSFFPPWFSEALNRDRQELLTDVSAMALPFIDRLLGGLSTRVASQESSSVLARFFKTAVTDDKKEVLIRGMLRQALQVVAGGESAIATQVAEQLLAPILGSTEAMLTLLGDVLLWLLAYGRFDGRHTGILLTMGRDLYRGRLDLIEDSMTGEPRLTARLPDRVLDTSSPTQEHVFRAIAAAWKGELRANPAWATLGKRVTVHSQGGCPMGEPGASVTDAYGAVHGCPGLYVMDAAAFPVSVGVNPSATITAIAEWKIEQFLVATADDDRHAKALKRQGDARRAAAAAWVDDGGRSHIDPLNHMKAPRPDRRLDRFKALGLKFREYSSGHLDTLVGPLTDFTTVETLPKDLTPFTDAERAGLRSGCDVTLTLLACTDDLRRLISQTSAAAPHSLQVRGFVTLREQGASRTLRVKRGSVLQMFCSPAAPTRPPIKWFRYALQFGAGRDAGQLFGAKVLRTHKDLDLWIDTSTIYLYLSAAGRSYRGVARVSISDFLQRQLPSMDVTNTNDQARRSWALAAFYKYFVGELAEVYMKRPEAVREFFTKLLTDIHV